MLNGDLFVAKRKKKVLIRKMTHTEWVYVIFSVKLDWFFI